MKGKPIARYFISDLHIGDTGRADDFNREEELINFLDYVQARDGRLFLVGDIIEGLQMCLKKIVWNRSKLLQRLFTDFTFHYIVGNHDYLPFARYFPSEWREAGIIIQHGHQFDKYNREPNTCIGRWGAKLGGFFERILHPDSDRWCMELLELRKHITPAAEGYPGTYGEYIKGAESLLQKAPQADVVIMGHTHRGGIWKLPHGGIYANCGAWCGVAYPSYIKVTEKMVSFHNGVNHNILSEVSRNVKKKKRRCKSYHCDTTICNGNISRKSVR